MKKIFFKFLLINIIFLLSNRLLTAQETWTATSMTNAPSIREYHTVIWAGDKMIVWGGYDGISLKTGGIYYPSSNTWDSTSTINAPLARVHHTSIWTGNKMIVWGGGANPSFTNTGGIYDPSINSWILTSNINAPTARQLHTAIWTGTKMIIWGGVVGNGFLNTGSIYDPSFNTWTEISITNAPTERSHQTAIWTGTKMIVWGGYGNGGCLKTGGIYDPSTNTWTATSIINAPSRREYHIAVWTGSKMIIWGGRLDSVNYTFRYNTGGIYDPSTDTWTTTSTENAPSARDWHTAVWTGSKMIVWGGYENNFLNTGGIYDPLANTWTTTLTENAPSAREYHKSVWTGTRMIIWGGLGSGFLLNTGGVYYNPAVIRIIKISSDLPSSFSLQQNYPNPFNPTTKIKFDIPLDSRLRGNDRGSGFVSLKIYDILGKEIATLVNEKLSPGTYSVEWNASQQPNGIYFYKLQSERFSETKRMIVLK